MKELNVFGMDVLLFTHFEFCAELHCVFELMEWNVLAENYQYFSFFIMYTV